MPVLYVAGGLVVIGGLALLFITRYNNPYNRAKRQQRAAYKRLNAILQNALREAQVAVGKRSWGNFGSWRDML